MKKKLEVKCPQCKTKFEFSSSEFRPFCCEQCQNIDMGMWFDESFAIPAHEVEDDFSGDGSNEH